MTRKLTTTTIDQWFIRDSVRRPGSNGICGVVNGHPNKVDGMKIRTSDLVGKIVNRYETIIVTETGTHYRLLDPLPSYEAQSPGARDRLLASLPDVFEHVKLPTEDADASR